MDNFVLKYMIQLIIQLVGRQKLIQSNQYNAAVFLFWESISPLDVS